MKFRTEYEPTKAPFILDPGKPVVLVGSCFSQNMAAKMREHCWENFLPAGTLYNPISIATALNMLINIEKGPNLFEKSLFCHEGIWHSDKFDSSFSNVEKSLCIDKFLQKQQEFLNTLEAGAAIIITFGTAIAYNSVESGITVGNCHKLPADRFTRTRLSISDVWSFTDVIIEEIRQRFPDVKFIFTVSPVRHLKDGFTGNSRSKAILQLGVEEICKYNEGCVYFPAYEILNDDLRDYRFYASDLCHPSEKAIEYIWEKFCTTFLSPSGMEHLKAGLRLHKASQHRSLLQS